MRTVGVFDFGSTAIKGSLIAEDSSVIHSISKEHETIYKGKFIEQDAAVQYETFKDITKTFISNLKGNQLAGMIFIGQMQDIICLNEEGIPLANMILYSDTRAVSESEEIKREFGEDRLIKSFGNNLDASIPFAKLRWIKNNESYYNNINKILFSPKDYIIYKLTGEYVCDLTNGSTTGFIDIYKKDYNDELIKFYNIDKSILPRLYKTSQIAGYSKAINGIEETEGIPIYAGIGDAGATAFASGITNTGEVNINLGTTGWTSKISKTPSQDGNVFNLIDYSGGMYINVVPFFNAGNVHKWVKNTFTSNNSYEEIDEILNKRIPGSNEVLFMPYLVGERFPVVDDKIRGAYYGITPNTGKIDLVSSALEGVGYSLRQGIEMIEKDMSKVTIIGGGGRVIEWNKIIADILAHPVEVYDDSEFIAGIALASLVFLDLNIIIDIKDFVSKVSKVRHVEPNMDNNYDELYKRYIQLYPKLKGI